MEKANEILDFWLTKGPKIWWSKDDATDLEIKEKFGILYQAACKGELQDWRDEPDPALAKVSLLDQFSRNLFRGSAKSFEQDELALEIARYALSREFNLKCNQELRNFFYLPFMHSEKIANQEFCVKIMHAHADCNSLRAALIHRAIIQRFGRFPHRNEVLNRHTTPAEQEFLDSGGFSG